MARGLFVFSLILINSVNIQEATVTILGKICYDNLGCFESVNVSNVLTQAFIFALPDSPHLVDTTFFLTTRTTQNDPVVVSYDEPETIKRVDCSKKTIFLVHGLTQNSTSQPYVDFRTAIFYMFDYNVISVDWSNATKDFRHFEAPVNAQLVGRQIAHLIKTMTAVCGLKLRDVHLVGHSLGGQVVGFAGAWFQTITNRKIGRITGSDPAKYTIAGVSPYYRLDPTDADFVDVVHTDTVYGYHPPSGHVDYYVNDGIMQPACIGSTLRYCSHAMSLVYITESVYSRCPFTSHPCPSMSPGTEPKFNCTCNNNCGRMGYYSDTVPVRGLQFLNTKSTSPYCIN